MRHVAHSELEQLLADDDPVDTSSSSSDRDYRPIPSRPRAHDSEAGGSSSTPQTSQTDPALLAILQTLQQTQQRQAEEQSWFAREKAAALAQVQLRKDQFQ